MCISESTTWFAMILPEIETKIAQVVAQAISLSAPEALRVYRALRDASDDILQVIAAGKSSAPMPSAAVVPIRSATPATTAVGIKDAAAKLKMSVSSLEGRMDQPAFQAMRVHNGTNRRLFSLEKIEAFLRQRQG